MESLIGLVYLHISWLSRYSSMYAGWQQIWSIPGATNTKVNYYNMLMLLKCSDKDTLKLLKSHFKPWICFEDNQIIIDYVPNQNYILTAK